MSIWSHAKQDQVKAWSVSGFEIEGLADRLLVFGSGRGCVRIFSVHAEDLLLLYRQMAKQRFPGHPIVAFGIAGRDVALIAPKETDFVPCDAVSKYRVGC